MPGCLKDETQKLYLALRPTSLWQPRCMVAPRCPGAWAIRSPAGWPHAQLELKSCDPKRKEGRKGYWDIISNLCQSRLTFSDLPSTSRDNSDNTAE